LTGRYSKFLTSYAHAYLTYLSRTSSTHRMHQPIPFLSPWACALCLLTAYALESRVGWAPARRERTNERTTFDLKLGVVPAVSPSTKKFFRFQWNFICRYRSM